ncbi:MAG: elongation factor P maturation arginine rhamnosyltransferase EarP [Betaproteobacteria bacterium]|nr:elongation factor P maturation arginine rhamnosyltransferase EarP [Betaproteobacteria bacterium]
MTERRSRDARRAPAAIRCDIFCTVVDNYGDIGVAYRLARQLADEQGFKVRLWADRLDLLGRLCAQADPASPCQELSGVEVRQWSAPFPAVDPADVVIEAFGCALPDRYLAQMVAQDPKPVWINLEYLSAETWTLGCHGLASPHPRLPLTKHFFFPGFAPDSGGIIHERSLDARRRAFQEDPRALNAFWQSLGLPGATDRELRVSLFSYENAAIARLLAQWADSPQPVRLLVPEGRSTAQLCAFLGEEGLAPGVERAVGSLTVHMLPFVEQARYDHLLWACDVNFVRGEDSFVRAQLAGRPFVWHIYPQDEQAHAAKLRAFMALYCAALPEAAGAALRAFWEGWNDAQAVQAPWGAFWAHRGALQEHAQRWALSVSHTPGLAANLGEFCKIRL